MRGSHGREECSSCGKNFTVAIQRLQKSCLQSSPYAQPLGSKVTHANADLQHDASRVVLQNFADAVPRHRTLRFNQAKTRPLLVTRLLDILFPTAHPYAALPKGHPTPPALISTHDAHIVPRCRGVLLLTFKRGR